MQALQKEKELKAKPFVKWAGGKRQLLPELLNRLPQVFNTYHEPFIGGGALFFELQPKEAFLADISTELINTYRVVKEFPEELLEILSEFKNEKEFYYFVRDMDRNPEYDSFSDIRKAARFIYLNKTCFNGLYRVNSKGQFNVPFGDYKNPTFADSETILACSQALAGTRIQRASFLEVQKHVQKGDFVYFDPPYVPLSKTSSFTAYSKGGFGEAEQLALRDLFLHLSQKGAFVMLSNSDTEFVRQAYKEFKIEEVQATRALNSDAKKRGKISELIIRNY